MWSPIKVSMVEKLPKQQEPCYYCKNLDYDQVCGICMRHRPPKGAVDELIEYMDRQILEDLNALVPRGCGRKYRELDEEWEGV